MNCKENLPAIICLANQPGKNGGSASRGNPLLCGTSIWIASRWNCSQSLSILRFLLSVNGIEEKWRRGNRAAKRQKTNMGIHPFWGNERCFICFSEAKRFPAIFPPALTFSFVLSLVSRQEKEHTLLAIHHFTTLTRPLSYFHL